MPDENEVRTREEDVRAWYSVYQYKCQLFQDRFASLLKEALRANAHDDAKLDTRTKSVDSLVDKATKILPSGEFKYADPRTEITDLVGARILVPLSTDLAPVVTTLKQTFEVDEELERGDEEGHVDVPGYRSLHLLVRLREQDLQGPELREFQDMTVEIQVRTTLQHAWASLQHDLMYKTERAPSAAVRRRLIALAGLLELADREFVSVRQAHSELRDIPSPGPDDQGDARLTAAALRHAAENLLEEEYPAAHEWFVELKSVLADLRIESTGQLRDTLKDWSESAPEVARHVRVTKPWANSAYVVDLLVRLALREQYFERRWETTDDGSSTEEDRREARAAFHEELALVESGLAR